MKTDDALETLLNERDVARVTGLSLSTVRRWRFLGQGPSYIKVSGSAVRYRAQDLQKYIDSRRTGGSQAEAR
jgi:predicted DNA-binding transcriptional regulator AlpA